MSNASLGKSQLTIQGFLPTIILVVMTPTFSTVLTKFANRLTEMENYETIDGESCAPLLRLD